MPTVQANGLNLHVNRFRSGPEGDRPIIVFIHGLAVVDNASGSFVLGLHFATQADVITYDLRGHGRSDLAPSGYQVSDHVGDLVALLDALDITQPVHLVALSYGGAIGAVMAIRHPERVASLSLVDGLVPVEGWQKDLVGLVEGFEQGEAEARADGVPPEEVEKAIIERSLETYKAYGVTRRRAAAVTKRVIRMFHNTTLQHDIRNEPVYSKEDYARIGCPVLGIYGDQSPIYWMGELLPELIPGIELHTFSGADHLSVFWRIDELRPLVRRFLGLPMPGSPKGDSPATGGDPGAATTGEAS